MTDKVWFPSVSFNPSNMVLYKYYAEDSKYSRKPPEKNVHDQIGVSRKQAQRIRKSIEWLYLISRKKTCYNSRTGKYFNFKINMITLTIPSPYEMSDKEVLRKLLKPFLRRLRIDIKGAMYVWKAEVQDNGAVHFHINTNVFIKLDWLKLTWNKILINENLLENTKQMTNTTTDIKAIKNPETLGKYLANYVSKKDIKKKAWKRYLRRFGKKLKQNENVCVLPKRYYAMNKRKIEIKLWDCSNAIKKIKIGQVDYDSVLANAMHEYITKENEIKKDYMTIYHSIDWKKNLKNPIWLKIKNSLKEVEKIEMQTETKMII